jgi:uncharacterized protein (DUF433 family)
MSGQLAMKQVMAAHLQRVEWSFQTGLPVRLFPAPALPIPGSQRVIVIDPRISFGRAVIASRSIRTATIVSRIDAGESPEVVAEDYRIEPYEVEAAILFERAA